MSQMPDESPSPRRAHPRLEGAPEGREGPMKRTHAAVAVVLQLAGDLAAAQTPEGIRAAKPGFSASLAASWRTEVDFSLPPAAPGAVFAYTFTDYDRRCSKTVYGDAGYWSRIRRAAVYAALASADWEWNPRDERVGPRPHRQVLHERARPVHGRRRLDRSGDDAPWRHRHQDCRRRGARQALAGTRPNDAA